ncbi:helix-turn-helix domain-containing protein [Peribacillus simplex]|uniref:Helix-turn-helix domain-containing protein n=1 Tax=Peribacillus simplex TaxID=1478 RepID=A0A8B5Y3H8_9BACI|nr:helix-turn-helix domain-containing protein [Peribacillus simplex]TVX83304.1 helix-turn-helix domain-containing protein [Peribacillus simplex]
MITIIGLERLIKTFGFSINQIAQELGIGKQTVYDWLKGKRKIPKERIEQLSKIPEFDHIDKKLFQKEIDEATELEITLAHLNYLSARDSEEIVDEDGNVFILDPHAQSRRAMEMHMLDESEEELKRTRALLHNDTDYLSGLNHSIGESYSLALAALNGIFQQNDASKIKAVTDLLVLINMNDMTDELDKGLKELLKKHDILGGGMFG